MSLFSKNSFDSSKCVSMLELTQKRIDILKKKRSIIAKQSRDDVAKLLERRQDANAAARAEHIFREVNIVGAYEILEKHCQLVIKGISAIKSSKKECSSELKEAIASLIYAAPRCGDLQELQKVRDIFISRYGAEYVTSILELRPECAVNTQIIQKLSSQPPNSDTRLNLLKEIALEYKIDWNYQRAVIASFKNGEASKPKVASKQGLAADNEPPSIPADAKPKEPTASLAAQTASPGKASIAKSELPELVKENQSSVVSGNSSDKYGHKGVAGSARQNSAPSKALDSSPKRGDTKKSSSLGSSTVDKSMHQDRSKGNASLPARNSGPSALHRAEPRKEDIVDKKQVSATNIEKPSSFFMYQDDERHPTLGANNAADGNRALQHKAKVSPIQLSDTSVSGSPQELGGPMPPAFYQAKVFSLKPGPHSIANHETDHSGESLAAKQYARAYQNYVKVDTAKRDENSRVKGPPQVDVQSIQSTQGAYSPKVDPIATNNTIDAHVDSMAAKHYKDYKNVYQQVQDHKSSYKAMDKEEASTFTKDHTRGQMKGTHRSKEREGLERTAGPNARPSTQSDLRSLKVEVDQELEDLEIAIASAARAAAVAIDMVRTCSIRSRADKKGSQRERNFPTHTSHGCLSSETGLESRKDFHNTSIQQESVNNKKVNLHSKGKSDIDHTEPYQEQEPDLLDTEMPHFDAYSSDESIVDEPSFYSKDRNNDGRKDLGKASHTPSKFFITARDRHESSHVSVKKNLMKERFLNLHDEDCAESVDSLSPRSSSSSYQHSSSEVVSLQPSYKTQREYEKHDNARVWGAAMPARSNVYATDVEISYRNSSTKSTNDNVGDKGVPRWQGSTGDAGKKNWAMGTNVQPPSHGYVHHDATNTQNSAVKSHGISRRTVRP